MFDEIYWEFIDPRYFGLFTTLEKLMGLPSEEERGNTDAFVEKMQRARECKLVSHYSIEEQVDL